MKRLQGKIAIVTGASRNKGIGSAICRALASEGANIFFTHWTPFDELQKRKDESFPTLFQEELSHMGVKSNHMSINLAEADACERLLDTVEENLGIPSILVNNATHCQAVDYNDLTNELLDMHYTVNVRGTCMLSTHFVKRYGERVEGRIINLVSGQEKTPVPGNIAYQTTKGAVSIFTQCFAREVASQGITVNAVDPGPTDSGWVTDEIREFLQPKFPTGRVGLPQDAAKLITFLATDDAQWITGQIIHSDGGFWD